MTIVQIIRAIGIINTDETDPDRWDKIFCSPAGVNDVHRTTLLASVVISENQWFNCVFQDKSSHPNAPSVIGPTTTSGIRFIRAIGDCFFRLERTHQDQATVKEEEEEEEGRSGNWRWLFRVSISLGSRKRRAEHS